MSSFVVVVNNETNKIKIQI